MTEINWGYNCLTVGIHHGRPEELWQMPLFQAWMIFSEADLREIVIARIYNDALQFVEHGSEPVMPKEWAIKVKELAEEEFSAMLQRKVEEIGDYYKSSIFQRDVKSVIEFLKDNKLNPGYKPLHGHDSINMLCRILGVSCSQRASSITGWT